MAASTLRLAPVSSRPVPLRLPRQRSLLQYTLELTVRQAREMLAAWADEQHAVTGWRDEAVRAALAAGVSKSEIHRLTGIARSTIDHIADREQGAGEDAE